MNLTAGALPLFGPIHIAISLIAVVSGAFSLVRYKAVFPENTIGKIYIVATILTCITGFGLFAHGGFSKAHAFSIFTLLVLGIAGIARRRGSKSVETVCYSATFLFHMMPMVTELTTRFPVGAPLLASSDAPQLKLLKAALFVVFLIGASWQIRRQRVARSSQ